MFKEVDMSQPAAHNILSTSSYDPILVETPQTQIGPRKDVSGFSLTLAVQWLMYKWNQGKTFCRSWLNRSPQYVPLAADAPLNVP